MNLAPLKAAPDLAATPYFACEASAEACRTQEPGVSKDCGDLRDLSSVTKERTLPSTPLAGAPVSFWAPFRQALKKVTYGVAVGAVLTGIMFGGGSQGLAAIDRGVTIDRGRLELPLQPLTRPHLPIMTSHSVTFTWNMNTHTDRNGQPFPPGRGVAGYILEEKNASGVFVPRDIGPGSCLDNGLTATCTFRLLNVQPGFHTYRMRAYAINPDGTRSVSVPSNEASKLVLP
ncbi:MAG: hypothetical protein IT384_16750 [Deltaproteobacteria bacterium]|nr:hypothetical protein [Deltaproteobacteria bacterium]